MKILDFITEINARIGKAVSFLIWAGIVVLCYEVVARYGRGQPTLWAHGYTQRIFGSYFVLIGAYTLIQRALGPDPDTRRLAILSGCLAVQRIGRQRAGASHVATQACSVCRLSDDHRAGHCRDASLIHHNDKPAPRRSREYLIWARNS